jgi:fervidolysin-like protein
MRAGDAEDSSNEARYSSNKLIVRLKSEHRRDSGALSEVLSWLPQDARCESEFDELGIAVITLPDGADPVQIAREIEQHEIVEYAEPEFLDSGANK